MNPQDQQKIRLPVLLKPKTKLLPRSLNLRLKMLEKKIMVAAVNKLPPLLRRPLCLQKTR